MAVPQGRRFRPLGGDFAHKGGDLADPFRVETEHGVGPELDRDRPFRVVAKREAGHSQVGGLLLDAARIGQHRLRVGLQRKELEVAGRFDQLQSRRDLGLGGQAGAGPGVDREEDRHVLGYGVQGCDSFKEERSVDEGGAVEGHQQVAAGLQSVLAAGLQRPETVFERDQAVDHRVADEVDLVPGDVLALEVADRLFGMHIELVGDRVGEDPVDLLGHGAVVAAQTGLDVADGDAQLHGGQCGGHGRVHVPGHHHQVGRVRDQQRFEAFHHLGGLLGVGAGADLEHVVGRGNAELFEEDLGHQAVVMLARMDDHLLAFGHAITQGGDDRGHLDEVRSSAENVDNSHEKRRLSVSGRSNREAQGCLRGNFD